MFGKKLINTNAGGSCTDTVDLYNPFPDGGGVALYQLNGDATDVSGNYDGTWVGTPAYGTGQFGQAATFNGSNQGINLPSVNLGGSFTISCWYKHDGNDNNYNATIVGSSDENPSIIHNRFSTLNSLSYDTTGSSIEILSNVATNTWYNIVVTQDGTDVKTYVNGVFSSSGTVTALTATIEGIGYDPNQTRWLSGSVDQVRLFSRVLRPYEIEALYKEEYCTPTIVPSEHFNTVTYSGNSVNNREISNVGFATDFTWIKNRSSTAAHNIFDSVRGAVNSLSSNTTGAEDTSPDFGFLASFESNGFTLGNGSGAAGYSGNWETNETGQDYVAWNFKAGGAAVTNTDGTITSQVSANTEAGFSIVSYTGNGAAGATIGHGLGVKPDMIIVKNRDISSNFVCYNSNLGATKYLLLNSANAQGDLTEIWNDTEPTDSVYSVGFSTNLNGNGNNLIAYCFAEVEGFSNFGSYVGNGSSSGPTIVTGFEPAFVMIKNADDTGDWAMFDNKRNPTNPVNNRLMSNLSSQESQNSTTRVLNFLTNGFSINSTNQDINAINDNYIYMAFAADPTTIEPTLEDSFNTVTYTGNGGTGSRSITGVGFQPDFVWTKQISAGFHGLHTSVQGKPYQFTNLTAAEQADAWYNNYGWVDSYDSDGFTLIGGNDVNNGTINASGIDYVAWNWKGAELPAINSNGSIPSVVSANPAAGFSIVSYTGNGVIPSTYGHGLNDTPKVVIVKNRDGSSDWTFNFDLTPTDAVFGQLNNTAAMPRSTWMGGTSSVVSMLFENGNLQNANGNDYIAYCFAEVAGFSKFGSYTGTGSAGQKITTGFEPAFVMLKKSSSAGAWIMLDNKRDTTNPNTARLYANASDAETNPSFGINILSDGFDFNAGSYNDNAATYIYMAFANQF